jgi:hypothetical protein
MTFPSSSLTLRALLLFAGFSAVTAEALSFGAGPKIGASFAGADVDGVEDEERRTGLVIGAVTEFGVTSPYSVVLEPSYLMRGARFDVAGASARGDLDYFEIPVLAKAKFGNLSTAHAFLFLGPSFGFLTSSEGRVGIFTDSFEDQAAGFHVAGDIGAGLAYRLRKYIYVAADLRYSHGFTNALEEDIGTIESWYARDIRAAGSILIHLIE